MSSSLDIEALLRQILNADDNDTQFDPILAALVNGTTTSSLAASDILTVLTSSKDISSTSFALSTHFQNLALDHPFLLPHLTSLLLSICNAPRSAQRDEFLTEFTHSLSDLSRSLYGQLFESTRCLDHTLIRYYERVNMFQACLYAVLASDGPGKWPVVTETDALFTLCMGLEDHVDSHQSADLDVAAAAWWFVHAGGVIRRLCEEGPERRSATEGMAVKGRLWAGELGFSLPRWNFWRDRFEQIASGDCSAHVREAAGVAVRVMRSIDG